MTILKFFKPNIIDFWVKFGIKLGYRLRIQLHLIFFLLDVNFHKSIIDLHFFLISFMLAKFQKDQRSIAMSSTKCFNFEFL